MSKFKNNFYLELQVHDSPSPLYKFFFTRTSNDIVQQITINKVKSPFGNCQLGTIPYFLTTTYMARNLFNCRFDYSFLFVILYVMSRVYYNRVLVNVRLEEYKNKKLDDPWFKRIIKRKSRPYFNRPDIKMIDLDLDLTKLINRSIITSDLEHCKEKSTQQIQIYKMDFSILTDEAI
jgi:hypothetical protein